MIYILTRTSISSAYPIFAQQGYENPREATGRIVCANCHLANKPVEIEVPQAVLPDTVFEAVVRIPYDMQLKQAQGQATSYTTRGFQIFNMTSMSQVEPPKHGLDPSIMTSLPIFLYKKSEQHTIECSICLSTIEDGELVRILPNCMHIFHLECIDKLFDCHSTCPICRAEAKPRLSPEPREGIVSRLSPSTPPMESGNLCVTVNLEGTSSSGNGTSSRLSSCKRIIILSRERSFQGIPAQSCSREDHVDDLVSELTILRARSTTGVIHLSNRLLGRILSVPVPRPFTFLVFFDSQKVHSHSEISLPTLKNEFLILASSFHTNNPANNKSFFFEIEFQESRVSFALFGVKSLPHVCLVPLFSTDFERDLIQMESSDFSRHAESMAEFVEAKSKHTVGPIHRPGFISKKQKMSIIELALILSLFVLKKIISGNTLMHNKNAWMVGSIFVYFFSVSGTMYNIINKIPIAMVDRDDPGKLVFF
ncbi:putative dolichyl-diphosphooligosaccharide--protein glycosyltransferase subunit 3 [Capsicum annuum]|uniref:Dolichyl-diphosphooligosaccharide--protein glycosyltransferase subunit 3 n=1 Tax=Capsicum annuum TaxID=4072 RepID=A0A2G2YJ47_CAPAN|nr:putative dolichyl-diphosphooligosaccharide--protein glycosyltransferase subunit 3 [Capsicum annuum]